MSGEIIINQAPEVKENIVKISRLLEGYKVYIEQGINQVKYVESNFVQIQQTLIQRRNNLESSYSSACQYAKVSDEALRQKEILEKQLLKCKQDEKKLHQCYSDLQEIQQGLNLIYKQSNLDADNARTLAQKCTVLISKIVESF